MKSSSALLSRYVHNGVNPAKASDKVHEKVKSQLALISPRKYARAIEIRNSILRRDLDTIWESVRGKPGPLWMSLTVKMPCPHCRVKGESYRCSECLWTKAAMACGLEARVMACGNIRFGGLTLSDVSSPGHKYFKILYLPKMACVTVSIPDMVRDPNARKIAAKEYGECARFLDAHAKWASSQSWGRKA